ncbi:hypothetical protein IWT5_01261 [Secundilactobacillus silagincola]|uniref:Uncharacterized protein n=2 Tax=Secundilactobacillus silagincola TaxID=1714681 RepID=A0A1Z5J2I3_9LACO|nr:hypothetical protein IWT5_01261 [Secundilactobacillus silagincola]
MKDSEFCDHADLNYVVFNVTIDDASDLSTHGDFYKLLQPVEEPFQFLFNQITYTDDSAQLILTALSLTEVPLYSVATTLLDSKQGLHYIITNQGHGRAPIDIPWYDEPESGNTLSETVSLKIRDKSLCRSEDKVRHYLESISDTVNLVIINKIDVFPRKISRVLFTLISLDEITEADVFTTDSLLGDYGRFRYHIDDHCLNIGEKRLKVWY